MQTRNVPAQSGLYRPEFEHDACGIGALAHLKGVRSHQMIDDALSVLVNLEHRGGKGLEHNTGDGAGILFQVPHHFFRKEAQKYGHLLPDEGDYGVAMLFFPQDERGVEVSKRIFEEGCAKAGLPLLFWREVPIDPHDLGSTARMPPYGGKGRRCRACAEGSYLLCVLFQRTYHRVQGHACCYPDAPFLPGPFRCSGEDRNRIGSFALLHEHHPFVGTCPSESLHHP